ncbi:nitrogen permease regulator 2 [Radiomyces spectabilis]|uniref:nitrogen permease regulator 2 n=1 Tax=Radiomyces spectabilis TaxID=64574 RepID=UPI00221F97FF|nr:nitrogen permease regulator 2 [Radiomyces spectabilis]KAI8381589.1 nitrogen permease regulator 2 [Radiomyces spectabilis]
MLVTRLENFWWSSPRHQFATIVSFLMEFQGFPRIHSIFYAVFDIIKGTVVKHQVPEGSITPQSPDDANGNTVVSSTKPLIDFEAISEYIIPKKQLYKRLVTICANNYKVMGCPVVLHDHEKYRDFRNEFRFNCCFVFERDAETGSYEAVVRKLSRVLEGLELECDFLSQDANSESRTVQNVIEQLFEDLNSYCECQIPINSCNTINLKLFPTYPNPQPVSDYQVPVCTVDLKKIMTPNWDITVQKVAQHIDGTNHVKRIAELANCRPEWARQCMEHLMYYGCIIMTDIFQFANIYAVKPDITRLIDMKSGLAQECLRYVTLPNHPPPSLSRVFALYCGLQYGSSVRDWIEEHQVSNLPIDVRRFISFGIIKGLIYRVHKYPMLTNTSHSNDNNAPSFPVRTQYSKIINLNTGTTIHPDIIPFLDGRHHYDEICTALKCSPQELDEQLGFQNNTLNPASSASLIHDRNYDHHPPEIHHQGHDKVEQDHEENAQWCIRFIYR